MCFASDRPDGLDGIGSEEAARLLDENGLGGFEALWSLDAPWVERPNYRRKGWSGVCRLEVQDADHRKTGLYLKRQQGHCYRSVKPPFSSRPTAYREYRHLVRMAALAIGAPQVLYYGERKDGGTWQAILVTRGISQAVSLEEYLRRGPDRPTVEMESVLRNTARLISRFHRQHFMHGALYGKHVLLGRAFDEAKEPALPSGKPMAFLIDLEKARRRPLHWRIAARDLGQLYRHTPWQHWQWRFFLDRYLAETRMATMRVFLEACIHREVRRKKGRSVSPPTIHSRPIPLARPTGPN